MMPPTAPILTQTWGSPCGELLLGSCGAELCLCDWVKGGRAERSLAQLQRRLHTPAGSTESPALQQACSWLQEYFAGNASACPLPLRLVGTPFQQRVWQHLRQIPCGSTLSYGELAQSLGCPRGTRAVARAVGANPLALIIPCHRIIGSRGQLGGYSGGATTKQYLLQREQAERDTSRPATRQG